MDPLFRPFLEEKDFPNPSQALDSQKAREILAAHLKAVLAYMNWEGEYRLVYFPYFSPVEALTDRILGEEYNFNVDVDLEGKVTFFHQNIATPLPKLPDSWAKLSEAQIKDILLQNLEMDLLYVPQHDPLTGEQKQILLLYSPRFQGYVLDAFTGQPLELPLRPG